MTERSDAIRGAEAQQLLDNELLKEALAIIERKLVDQLGQVDLPPERILKLQSVLAGKRIFERYLRDVVQSGVMAEMVEDERRKKAPPRR